MIMIFHYFFHSHCELLGCEKPTRLKTKPNHHFRSPRDQSPRRSQTQLARNSGPNRNASADSPRLQHVLSAQEERDLAERIKCGDVAARKELIMANLGLVICIVQRYRSSKLSYDDLVQEGNLGLIRASQDFDPSARESRFSTYARIWIISYINRALIANDSLIRTPEHVFLLRKRYRQVIDTLDELGQIGDPGMEQLSLEQLAQEIGVSVRQLKPSNATPNRARIARYHRQGERDVCDYRSDCRSPAARR